MEKRIFGLTWEQIDAMQQRRAVRQIDDVRLPGDYGADPLPDGKFRMVPSGDIVDKDEKETRLSRFRPGAGS